MRRTPMALLYCTALYQTKILKQKKKWRGGRFWCARCLTFTFKLETYTNVYPVQHIKQLCGRRG